MRIGIDCRYLSHGIIGGVHTYTKHLVTALITYHPENEYFLYIDRKKPFELTGLPEYVTTRVLPYWGPPSSVINDFFMHRAMRQDRLDIIHYPANYGFGPRGAKTVITLHDAINILPLKEIIRGHRKDIKTILMMTYLHLCSSLAVPRADLVVTVSEYSRREILRYSRIDPQKIIAVTNGPSPELKRVEDEGLLDDVRRRHGITKPFILADAVKNPAVIARAWPLLPEMVRNDWQIVYFSRRPDPLPVVQETVQAGYARLLVNPPSSDLAVLYSMARGFVFPSWIEGLGLPPLEAMTCGCPVIASDRGSIPEVTGGAAWIIDAEDERALAKHIETLYASPAEADRIRALGYRQAARFQWDQVAHRLIEVYRAML